MDDPHCRERFRRPNIFRLDRKHYHPPASKCKWAAVQGHEHCVSKRPWPGKRGGCLRAASIKRRHWCCEWSEEDRDAQDGWQEAEAVEAAADARLIEEKAAEGIVDLSEKVVAKDWSELDYVTIHLAAPLSTDEMALAEQELEMGTPMDLVAAKLGHFREATHCDDGDCSA